MTHFLDLNKAPLYCKKRKILFRPWLWLSSLGHHCQLYFNMKWCLKERALGTWLSTLYKWGDAVNDFHSRGLGAKCPSQQWVSQYKKILSPAAFCMQVLRAKTHFSKPEKSNLQFLRPQTKDARMTNFSCLHGQERHCLNNDNLSDIVVP